MVYVEDLVKAKARFCLQGFRQSNKHLLRKDSPTLSRSGFFRILQVVVSLDFKLFGGDEGEDWKTWPDAETACQDHGAHLASIASEKQNNAVLGLLAPEEFGGCWIGK